MKGIEGTHCRGARRGQRGQSGHTLEEHLSSWQTALRNMKSIEEHEEHCCVVETSEKDTSATHIKKTHCTLSC